MSLDSIFNPTRVALVGASDTPGKMGAVLWRNLSGFRGEVIPVTPSASHVGGVKAYPSLLEVEGDVDLAVLAVPARAAPRIARQADAKGVRAMVVLAGGFAETGAEGAALQEELAASAGRVRVVGPNCLGVQNLALGLNASITTEGRLEPGGVALISQSGAYGMAIHTRGEEDHIRFGKVYSSGNKMNIWDHEVIEYLRDDPETTVICLLLESVPGGRQLAEAIRSTTPHKPVIVAKTGRSEAGSRAARSHTGALATDDVIFGAAMRQAGALPARSGLEMLDIAQLLSSQPHPRGNRAAIITNSGGMGVELVDLLSGVGVETPRLSSELRAQVAARLPAFGSADNPVDMTPVWARFAELYPWLIETLARSGEVDLIIPMLLQRAAMDTAALEGILDSVRKLGAEGLQVPVYACWVAPRAVRSNADPLQAAGIPCLEWPERTARAAGQTVRHALRAPLPAPPESKLRAPVRRLSPGQMPAFPASELLAEYGIQTVETVTCRSLAEATVAAQSLQGPVVLKTGASIAHRTEFGGVRLGLSTPGQVSAAFSELAALGQTVLVQPQLEGVEMVVGGLREATFGPVVMVGVGGTAIEVTGDVVFALAPVGFEEALGMLRSLRGYPLLTGFRGAEATAVRRLAQIVTSIGELLTGQPDIVEIDLNPVLVTARQAIAVDWKLTAEMQDDPLEG